MDARDEIRFHITDIKYTSFKALNSGLYKISDPVLAGEFGVNYLTKHNVTVCFFIMFSRSHTNQFNKRLFSKKKNYFSRE